MVTWLRCENITKDFEARKMLCIAGLLLVVFFSAKSNLAYLNLRNAVGGFSPVDYIQVATNPEVAGRRFPNGVEQLNNSLVFHIYETAYKLGVSPDLCQRIIIITSVIFFAFSLLFFSYSILPGSPAIVHFLTVLFGLSTDVLNHDLARFGAASILSFGQMYGFANAFALIAISFAVKSQWIKCWPIIGIVFTFHPATAIYASVVCCSMLLIKIRQIVSKKFWIGWSIGVSIALFWMIAVILPSLNNFPRMSSETWINWSRFGNFHWFPFSMSVFKEEHFRRITPLLSLIILASTRLRMKTNISDETKKKLTISLISLVVLTILGLLASLFPIAPGIIKISFHRSSIFILVISLPLALDLLWGDLTSVSLFNSFIGCLCLITPLIGRNYLTPFLVGAWGFPIVFSILRFESEFFRYSQDHLKNTIIDYFVQVPAIMALINVIFLIVNSFAVWNDPAFVSEINIVIISIVFAVLIYLSKNRTIFSLNLKNAIKYFLIVSFVFLGIHGILKSELRLLPWRNLEKSTAYYNTQIWAKDNTKLGALFMVDPSINYGWEAYSQRPKFGSFRDLIHTGWLYTGNSLIFDEGIRRIRLFGVEPTAYLLKSLQNHKLSVGPEYHEFAKEVERAFYSLNKTDFMNLAKREGIEFVVFDKQKIKTIPLPIVYDNGYFCICSVFR